MWYCPGISFTRKIYADKYFSENFISTRGFVMPLAKIIGNRTLLYVHCFLFLGTALAESKELELRGVLRNDALANSANGKYFYADILENRLVLEKNADTWKLYTDGRLYLYYPEPGEDKKEYQANLIRSFIRY
jgi:hypothetical protein